MESTRSGYKTLNGSAASGNVVRWKLALIFGEAANDLTNPESLTRNARSRPLASTI
jgi:hypothetical protein